MNLYSATAFIRHLLTARSAEGHGVHSPFVFDFLTTVVRGKSDTQIIREVESLRREMLADRRVIRVTDLGAGSAVHKGQERKISEIASTATLPAKYSALLSRIARATQQIPHHRVNPGIQSDEAYSQLDSGELQKSGVNPMMQSDAAYGNHVSREALRSGIDPSLRAGVGDGQDDLQGAPPDQRSMAGERADLAIFSTRKSGKEEGSEHVGGEANLSGKKEKQEPLSNKERGNLADGEAEESQSREAGESRDKDIGDSSVGEGSCGPDESQSRPASESNEKFPGSLNHGAEGLEPVESHTGGQEPIDSHARWQESVESQAGWREPGELSKNHATLPVKPGPGSPGIILELGTSLGISTLALALAAPERRVVSVEGCPKLAEIARENLRRHGAANTEVLNMDFTAALRLLRSEGTSVSLAFIDGNHRGEALKQYVSEISTMGDEMIIVADDIHLNRDMYNTWRSLADPSLQAPASRKAPSRAEKIPRVHTGTASATAEEMPPVHTGTAPAAAEKTPPVQQAIAPATAEKMPPVHPGTAPATMETFRFGILFCLRSLTQRHYRIRY